MDGENRRGEVRFVVEWTLSRSRTRHEYWGLNGGMVEVSFLWGVCRYIFRRRMERRVRLSSLRIGASVSG